MVCKYICVYDMVQFKGWWSLGHGGEHIQLAPQAFSGTAYRTWAGMSTIRNLRRQDRYEHHVSEYSNPYEHTMSGRTEVLLLVTPTFTPCMSIALRTSLEWFMPIPNIGEEVELVFWCEQRCSNRVYRSISPAFVVETASRVQMIEEFAVGLASPEVKVTYLEVTPD